MSVIFVPVRHHSTACARLVADTIARVRPRHVLVEGPSDFNEWMGELYLEHRLPIAIYTGYTQQDRLHASWAPLCEYSPEWVALQAGREVGAQVRFIDLPAWDAAFGGHENRFADADLRYQQAHELLLERFHTQDSDALWDHLFEIGTGTAGDVAPLAERLDTYFTGLRGDAEADERDTAREAYMHRWIREAAAEAQGADVVVVTGGFHMPALRAMLERDGLEREQAQVDETEEGTEPTLGTMTSPKRPNWPDIPRPAEDEAPRSYLVPFSYLRLDSFAGYQSGMPSPAYYQRLWEAGPQEAGRFLAATVVARLREKKQVVSTPDLIAAQTLGPAFASMRGHGVPSRTDVLDGLASALIKNALDTPLPWGHRGVLARSWVLHRLRVIGLAGVDCIDGPADALDPELQETWVLGDAVLRGASVIEAASLGPTLDGAAEAALVQRLADAAISGQGSPDGADGPGGPDLALAARVLFDAVLCGHADLSSELLRRMTFLVGQSRDLAGLTWVLDTVLGLWLHGEHFHAAGKPALKDALERCLRCRRRGAARRTRCRAVLGNARCCPVEGERPRRSGGRRPQCRCPSCRCARRRGEAA